MTQLKITTNIHGQMDTASRGQLRSFFKSIGGPLGEQLAAAAQPQIERELRARAAALHQTEGQLPGLCAHKSPAGKTAPRIVLASGDSPMTFRRILPGKIL